MLTCYLACCFLIRRQLRGNICKLWQILQRSVQRAATSCILYNRESRLSCISVSCWPIFTSSIQFLLTGSLSTDWCTLRTLHPCIHNRPPPHHDDIGDIRERPLTARPHTLRPPNFWANGHSVPVLPWLKVGGLYVHQNVHLLPKKWGKISKRYILSSYNRERPNVAFRKNPFLRHTKIRLSREKKKKHTSSSHFATGSASSAAVTLTLTSRTQSHSHLTNKPRTAAPRTHRNTPRNAFFNTPDFCENNTTEKISIFFFAKNSATDMTYLNNYFRQLFRKVCSISRTCISNNSN